jgi:hypothetical protein
VALVVERLLLREGARNGNTFLKSMRVDFIVILGQTCSSLQAFFWFTTLCFHPGLLFLSTKSTVPDPRLLGQIFLFVLACLFAGFWLLVIRADTAYHTEKL